MKRGFLSLLALARLVSLARQKGLKLNSLTCEGFAAASGDDLRL